MELFAAMKNRVKWSAGFLPQQGSSAQGVGFQEEKASCIRTFDMGGVLIKIAKNERKTDDFKSVGRGKPQST